MKKTLLLTTALVCSYPIAPAFAQTASPSADKPQTTDATPTSDPTAANPASGEPKGDIVVTGSRIARRDFVSDSPIVTRSADQIKNSGSVSIESVLNRLPQFVPGQGAYTQAQGGRATLNLRGLGEQRNLILLDGRRLPPAAASGVVNINIIPQGILSGIETISGGASATYGSDAISGVVNFKSLRNFDGVQVDVQKGITDRGDVPQTNLNLVIGTKNADDTSHALLSVGYYDRARLNGSQRSFYNFGAPSSYIFGGVYTPTGNNLPSQAVVNTVFAKYGVAAGRVGNAGPLGFNDNGTLFSQQGGLNYQGASNQYIGLFNGSIVGSGSYNDFASSETRYSAFAKADHELSNGVKIYAQGLYVDDRVLIGAGWVPSILAVPTIPVTNPFIPADLAAILASRPNPTASFTYNRRFDNLPQRVIDDQATTYQFLVGATGGLGVGDLTWDIYGSTGKTRTTEIFRHAVLLSRVNNLLAAPDGGKSICAGGFNPFGVAAGANLSQACIAYLSVDTHAVTEVGQDVVEGQIQGSLFKLNGNDVKFAVSANYRKDRYAFSPDASIVGKDVMSAIVAPAAGGSREVKEAAVELFVPLLKDKPFFQSLDVDLGYRYSDYTITGSESTYKASLTWKPASMLLLRGGYEHAIRAPGLAELFNTSTGGLAQFGIPPSAGDPCDSRSAGRAGPNAAAIRTLCIANGVPAGIVDSFQFATNAIIGVASGSTALKPETANTLTLGAVLHPTTGSALLRGLSFSVDYYNINLKDAISTIAAGTTVNKCFNLDGSNPTYSATNFYCQFISRDGSGGITTVATPYLNLGGIKTSGIDFQFDWTGNLDDLGIGKNAGQIALNATVSWLQHYKISQLPGNPFLEYRNTIDSTPVTGLVLPNWRSQAVLTYTLSPVQIGVTWQHVPGMRDISAVTRPASPSKPTETYDRFDARISFSVTKNFELGLVVNNVADRSPPIVAGSQGLTSPGTYDIFGRSYMMSLRLKM
jgi:iron complex outermembrane receptor protein